MTIHHIAEHIAAATEPPASVDFRRNEQGRVIAKSQRNIRMAMERLGIKVRYDEFHDRTLIDGLDGYYIADDAAMNKMWLLIDERFEFLPQIEFFYAVVYEAARTLCVITLIA
jgi:hypothetical protein